MKMIILYIIHYNLLKSANYKKTIKLNLIIFNNNLLLKIYILFLNIFINFGLEFLTVE
jgi:hypothetical protein